MVKHRSGISTFASSKLCPQDETHGHCLFPRSISFLRRSFTTMAYSKSTWNSRVKKVFYLFFGVCICNTSLLRFKFSSFTIRHKSDESRWTQLITSLRSVWSVVFNEPQRTRPSAITTYANIPRWYRFFRFFVWFISFILDRKRSMHSHLDKLPHPTPQPGIWKLSIPTIDIN